MTPGNQKLNHAKRLEAQELVTALLASGQWTRQSLATKLGVGAMSITKYKLGRSMGSNRIREKLRALVAKLK